MHDLYLVCLDCRYLELHIKHIFLYCPYLLCYKYHFQGYLCLFNICWL
jgi:hypothetical protein